MKLQVPNKLNTGDLVATVSLSWGGPGIYKYRYDVGVKQLKENFGLEVIEMKSTLKSPEWIYDNPKARAQDFMDAFVNKKVDGIISTIGGDDSIRMLPYIDFEIITNNPKVFLGYSDSTISHFICYKAGVRSYYGPSIMAGFAENGGIFDYMKDSVNKTLFENNIIGEIKSNTDGWTNQHLGWDDINNQKVIRKLEKSKGWDYLQGNGTVKGELLGGCIDVFSFMWGTSIWPGKDEWKGKILFIETSEENISEENFERILRTMGVQGILGNLNGIIMGRAQNDKDYNNSLLKIINGEFGLNNLPIITKMDFGHTDPIFVIPIGAEIILDFDEKKVFINESGVT